MGGQIHTTSAKCRGANAIQRRRAFARVRALVLLLLAVSAFTIALLGAQDAQAMYLEGVRPPMETASRIVIAHVESVSGYRTATGELRTRVVLSALQDLRGTSSERFDLDVPGGTVGDTTVRISDAPVFGIGEDVAVFLDDQGTLVAGPDARLTVKSGRIVETSESVERFTGRVTASSASASVRRSFPETFGLISASPAASPVLQAATPLAETIEPASAAAGTLDTVTITGSGFGESMGTVEFFYRPGQPAIVADSDDIVAWDDETIVTRVPVGTVSGYAGASASSGPVTVVTVEGGRSDALPFEVTFGLGAAKWVAGATTFRVNAGCADTDDELALVLAGARVWAGASNFSVTYDGPTDEAVVGNGVNDISWGELPEGILGQASLMFVNGTMVETDIVLNDFYVWGDATAGADIDVQTVIAHELGHWLSLRDLYGETDADKVMCGTLSYGQTRRALMVEDREGIIRLYGSIGNEAPVTSARVTPSAWTSGTVAVALAATDASPGVAATYYRVGDGAPRSYRGPFEVAEEGRTHVGYWSIDAEGLAERETVATVRIDRTPPTTSVDTVSEGLTTLVTLASSDALSGVVATEYRIDGGAWNTGTAFQVSAESTHTIECASTDFAGNRETPVTCTVAPAGNETNLARISGRDRYETATAISRATFPAGRTTTAVLATGAGFADALAANGLAGALAAPVLLTPANDLHTTVVGELNRLGAREVIVVGGAGAISNDVVSTLEGLGYTVERIAGRDRYETAAMIADQIVAVTGTTPARAFLVRGDSFADALSAAPYAYSQRLPVLLTRPRSLPATTDSALRSTGIRTVTIVGGASAVGTPVESAIGSAGISVDRVAGDSRYATAASLLRYAVARGWTTPQAVGVATGVDFPDALGGGAAMGAMNGALVLTDPQWLVSASADAIADCATTVDEVRVFGGDAAVAPSVVDSIIGALAH